MRGGGERGTRNWERGTALSATVPRSAFRVPTLAFSRRRSPSGVEIVLQHQRRRERVDVVLPPPRLPAHLPHRRQHARRGEPLVPQRHRQPRLPADGGGDLAGRSRGCAFVAPLVERQAHHHARHRMGLEQGDQLAHGEALAGPAGPGREGVGGRLGFGGGRGADGLLAPGRRGQTTRGWEGGMVRRWATGRSRMTSELPVPLTSSKTPPSRRDRVSISAVAIMVSEPPASMLRAAPKNRFGFWSAFASTPPDRILPECGTTTLWARPRRVIESSRITTSLLCSTRRFAFSITMSATWT